VKRFRYLRDGPFLIGCSLYVINRWGLKPHVHSAFLHDHFNDLLLIPCALPPLLWVHRLLRIRSKESPPTFFEIMLHVAIWSVLFEVIGPHIIRRATGDFWDAIAYLIGGMAAGLWWNRNRFFGVMRSQDSSVRTEQSG
jgi:hypothetical protein